jgi:hypothetical protein
VCKRGYLRQERRNLVLGTGERVSSAAGQGHALSTCDGIMGRGASSAVPETRQEGGGKTQSTGISSAYIYIGAGRKGWWESLGRFAVGGGWSLRGWERVEIRRLVLFALFFGGHIEVVEG